MTAIREIVLIRHAHARPGQPGESDAVRPLSPTGDAEAEAAACWLAARPRPARVLCSPSERTRQTAARLLGDTGYADLRIDPRIYDATPGTLLDVLDAHPDAGPVWLVGHNPGLESLVALLSTGQSGDHRGMAPASVAVLHVAAGAALEPGAATLVEFWSP